MTEISRDRGAILLQKIATGTNFQRGIKAIRFEFSIAPRDTGFLSKKDILAWYDTVYSGKKKRVAFERAIRDLLKEQKLPLGSWWMHHTIEYALSNGRIHFLHPTAFADAFVELKGAHVSREGSYIEIKIYEGATQHDIKNFIHRYWSRIKPSHHIGTHEQIRQTADQIQKAECDILITKGRTDSTILKKRLGTSKTSSAKKAMLRRRKNAKR
jgi:hypothetical protein